MIFRRRETRLRRAKRTGPTTNLNPPVFAEKGHPSRLSKKGQQIKFVQEKSNVKQEQETRRPENRGGGKELKRAGEFEDRWN